MTIALGDDSGSDIERLHKDLSRYCHEHHVYMNIDRFTEGTTGRFARYIELKEGRYYTRVRISDIVYTDYSNHYIQVHTTSCVVRSYMSFEAFFPMLAPYSNFLWCCRNCMVNMDYIESFGQKEFLLKSGERIPISAARRRETVQKMQDGTFLSSKRKDQKGIGISSVLSISEKYNGIVRIEYQEQIFKISVIISQNP
ncbi:LytTR family transcriptional regulator DNA-binding domain-containing protein [Lachnospiraceae bacterium 62-26]